MANTTTVNPETSSTSWVDELVKEAQKIEKAEDKILARRRVVISALIDHIDPGRTGFRNVFVKTAARGYVRNTMIWSDGPTMFPSPDVHRGGFFVILQGKGGGGSIKQFCEATGDDQTLYRHRFTLWDLIVWERMPTPVEVR